MTGILMGFWRNTLWCVHQTMENPQSLSFKATCLPRYFADVPAVETRGTLKKWWLDLRENGTAFLFLIKMREIQACNVQWDWSWDRDLYTSEDLDGEWYQLSPTVRLDLFGKMKHHTELWEVDPCILMYIVPLDGWETRFVAPKGSPLNREHIWMYRKYEYPELRTLPPNH